jgi:ABC-type antimicrobial peptide transport system permease subunit
MNFLIGIFIGLREILAHKVRSFLTMIGIILGVASLVSMIGIVRGTFAMSKRWIEEMGGMGKIAVMPQEPPQRQRFLAGISPGRTLRDAEAIRRSCPLAVYVSPEVDVPGSVVQRKDKLFNVRVQGVREDILPINAYEVAQGRYFGDLDIERFASVAVIGTAVARALFEPNESPLGQAIRINGLPFVVIGVLKHYEIANRDRNPLEGKNEIVFIPISTMQQRFTGDKALTWLNVKAADVEHLDSLGEQLENTLLQTHRGIEDFRVETREEMKERFAEMENTFMMALGGVAAISLLIGGIGIMNVMLASINERIREIGIRKAVGARDWDIFIQFVAESVALSILGGLLGLLAGVGLVRLLDLLTQDAGLNPELSMQALAVGFFSSVGVGILSGLYPAVRAARLDPIEALRYE